MHKGQDSFLMSLSLATFANFHQCLLPQNQIDITSTIPTQYHHRSLDQTFLETFKVLIAIIRCKVVYVLVFNVSIRIIDYESYHTYYTLILFNQISYLFPLRGGQMKIQVHGLQMYQNRVLDNIKNVWKMVAALRTGLGWKNL